MLPNIAANRPLTKVQTPPAKARPLNIDLSEYSRRTFVPGLNLLACRIDTRSVAVLFSSGVGRRVSGTRECTSTSFIPEYCHNFM